HEALPDGAIIWYPQWNMRRPLEITDIDHLAQLIAALSLGDFGGVKRPRRTQRWAQVKPTHEGILFELHPADWSTEPRGPAIEYSTILAETIEQASEGIWAWMKRTSDQAG